MRLLLVEDDVLLGDGLAEGLRTFDYAVDWFKTAEDAWQASEQMPYDAVVLDLNLQRAGRSFEVSEEDGLQLLRRWRQHSRNMPVLILTARDGLEQRIHGLDCGADDYLVKPVAIAEIAARLRAMIRRSHGQAQPVWQYGPLSFNTNTHQVSWQGQTIDLSAHELVVLEALMSHPTKIFSKDALSEKLYDWAESVESNTIEVYIHHLRKKIHPQLIKTIRGLGYRLGAVELLGCGTQSPS